MSFLKNIFTNLLRIHSSFFTYFLFFKYFESVNSKSSILKFGGNRIRQILVKFTEFVNPGSTTALLIDDLENHVVSNLQPHHDNSFNKAPFVFRMIAGWNHHVGLSHFASNDKNFANIWIGAVSNCLQRLVSGLKTCPFSWVLCTLQSKASPKVPADHRSRITACKLIHARSILSIPSTNY
jgi:hypothetical protein